MKLAAEMFSMPYPDGWLDRIDETSEGVFIEGWAFYRHEGGASFPVVIITYEWEEIARIETGNVARMDVQNAFPECCLVGNIGFSVALSRDHIGSRGVAGIQVFVLNSDGTVSPLKKGFKRGLQVELRIPVKAASRTDVMAATVPL